jgi:aspartate/methionine/tyrosine aminotransferase
MSLPALSSEAQRIRPGVFSELQRRIDAHAARGGSLVPFHIGDTFLPPPPGAAFATSESFDPALYGYGATVGLPALRRAVADYVARRRPGTPPLDPESHVHIGVGATHALYCAARAVLDAGDDVLVASPYWPLAPGVFSACGARPVEVPLTQGLYAEPAADAAAPFRLALTPRTKALYVISPNNPDGKVLAAAHLAQLADFAIEHGLWIFSDEVYADNVYGAEHTSMRAIPRAAAQTIAIYSLSKSHALAGARVGFTIAAPEVVASMRRVSTHTVFNVPVLMQRSAAAALVGGDAWVSESAAIYTRSRALAIAHVSKLPVRFHAPEGASYLFIDFAEALAGRPLLRLLEQAIEHGVLLAPGEAFGDAYRTHARLCFTSVGPERLEEGLTALARAVSTLT